MALVFSELIDSRELTSSPDNAETRGIVRFNVYNDDKTAAIDQKAATDFANTELITNWPVFPGDAPTGDYVDIPFTGRFRIVYAGNLEWFGEAYYSAAKEIFNYVTWNISAGQELITKVDTVRYARVKADNALGTGVLGTAPDTQNAVGWDGKSVKGRNRVVPAFEFTVTNRKTTVDVDKAYVQVLRQSVGKVNNAVWAGFPVREVMFMGAAGRQLTTDIVGVTEYELAFRLAVGKTQTNASIGGGAEAITIPEIYPWENVDVVYHNREVGSAVVPVPRHVYVQEIATPIDFSTLDIDLSDTFLA